MSFLKNFIVVPAGIWQVPIIKVLKKKNLMYTHLTMMLWPLDTHTAKKILKLELII